MTQSEATLSAHSNPEDFYQRNVRAEAAAKTLVSTLFDQGLRITTVESCTGGGVAHTITNIPGASNVLLGSTVTYSNAAKIALGVPEEIIETFGVYSAQTAVAMGRAGLATSVGSDIAIATTGSLTRSDPVNPDSVPGEAFVAVVFGGIEESRKLHVPETVRAEGKLRIVHNALALAQHVLTQ